MGRKPKTIRFNGQVRPVWLAEEWNELSDSHTELSDAEFLSQFAPILAGFQSRRPYLEKCADVFERLVDRNCLTRSGMRIVEPASGRNVFVDIMAERGFDAIGMEPHGSITARWCALQGRDMLLVRIGSNHGRSMAPHWW